MFRLTKEEKDELVPKWHRFQTLKHSNTTPYAFTEHGVAMLASVLNSPVAIEISVIIIKIFVKLREVLLSHKELSLKLNELEHKLERHDEDIIAILSAIRQIMKEEEKPKGTFGFARD